MNNWECDEPVARIWSLGLWGANGETDPLGGRFSFFPANSYAAIPCLTGMLIGRPKDSETDFYRL